MIVVRSYHQEGNQLIVKLRCSCGEKRLLKRRSGDDVTIECPNCRAATTLFELQSSATVIWQQMDWVLEGVEDAGRAR